MKKILLLIFIGSFAFKAMAQSDEGEADLKAVYIYNFTKYVDWEAKNIGSDFIIGVIGSSPVIESLKEIARTSTIKNRKIVIRTFDRPEDIRSCQILFISRGLPFSLQSILNEVATGVLTISEEDGYCKQGTAFNFVIRNDKLKFEANLKAIDKAGLKASSQLLKLAKIIN